MPRKPSKAGITYYTTFNVAKLLGVSPPTVVNWINGGLLPAHRTPGGHRRISQTDLRTFTVEHDYPLPAEMVDTGADGAVVAPPQRAVAVQPPVVQRVLVVDDEPDFCSLVRDYLVFRNGFDVEVADSGFAAGLAVAHFRPDVILMDILMPDMDGFEVLRTLRADPNTRSIPVIACTAHSDGRIEERARTEGFVGYLEKPLRLDRLAATVTQAISGRVIPRHKG